LKAFQKSKSTCCDVEVYSVCIFEINLVEVFRPVSRYGRLVIRQRNNSIFKSFARYEEGIEKLTVDCAHLFPREDIYRNVAIYWNKFRNWKQECFYITWQRLISLNGKLKILKQELLYRVFHFLLDWQASARRFSKYLLHFLKVIITAIVF